MTTAPNRGSRKAASSQVSTPLKIVLRFTALLFFLAAAFQVYCAVTGYRPAGR